MRSRYNHHQHESLSLNRSRTDEQEQAADEELDSTVQRSKNPPAKQKKNYNFTQIKKSKSKIDSKN